VAYGTETRLRVQCPNSSKLVSQKKTGSQRLSVERSDGKLAQNFQLIDPPQNRPIAQHHQCCDPLAFKVPQIFGVIQMLEKMTVFLPTLGENSFQSG